MTQGYTHWVEEVQFLARRRGLYEATGLMASEIQAQIQNGTTKFQDRLYRVKVTDSFGYEQGLHIIYANVPPNAPELDALNSKVQFMISIEPVERRGWAVGQPAPEKLKISQFRGNRGIFRAKTGSPEVIIKYFIKWMNDNAAMLRGENTKSEWIDPVQGDDLDEANSTPVTKVFAKFHANQKSKSGGKYTVMLTGATADVLGQAQYAQVNLVDLNDEQLRKLAAVLGVKLESARPSTYAYPIYEDATSNQKGSVEHFNIVLGSKLTQYDVRLSAAERKRGRCNIYRLGHYLGALEKVRNDTAPFSTDSSNEAIQKWMEAVLNYFDEALPPVKNVLDQANAWIQNGTPPRLK